MADKDLLDELREKAAELIESKETDAVLTEEDLDEMNQDEFDNLVENMDQLDELSKSTLGNYIKKASKDVRDKTTRSMHLTNTANNMIDGPRADAYYDDAFSTEEKSKRRLRGIGKAVSRLTKEDLDISAIFDGEDLSEEFKQKVSALFEALVTSKVNEIEESYAKAFEDVISEQAQVALDESEELKEGLADKVDGYLDYIIEQWMANNELALDRGIRSELFESFMGGMRNLFVEHSINVPEGELEVLDELRESNEGLESKVDELLAENILMKQTLRDIEKAEIIREAAEGMTDLNAERFVELAESLSFDDEEVFSKKLETIRENFFRTGTQKQLSETATSSEELLNEEVETKRVDPKISSYVNALSRLSI